MSTSTSPQQNDARLLQLTPDDNIAAVTRTIEAGETVMIAGQMVTMSCRIPTGHKVAVTSIPRGERVTKYGAPIGTATQDIRPGDYVHTHNLASDYLPTFTLDGKNPFLKGN
jgi:hypothetical protein